MLFFIISLQMRIKKKCLWARNASTTQRTALITACKLNARSIESPFDGTETSPLDETSAVSEINSLAVSKNTKHCSNKFMFPENGIDLFLGIHTKSVQCSGAGVEKLRHVRVDDRLERQTYLELEDKDRFEFDPRNSLVPSDKGSFEQKTLTCRYIGQREIKTYAGSRLARPTRSSSSYASTSPASEISRNFALLRQRVPISTESRGWSKSRAKFPDEEKEGMTHNRASCSNTSIIKTDAVILLYSLLMFVSLVSLCLGNSNNNMIINRKNNILPKIKNEMRAHFNFVYPTYNFTLENDNQFKKVTDLSNSMKLSINVTNIKDAFDFREINGTVDHSKNNEEELYAISTISFERRKRSSNNSLGTSWDSPARNIDIFNNITQNTQRITSHQVIRYFDIVTTDFARSFDQNEPLQDRFDDDIEHKIYTITDKNIQLSPSDFERTAPKQQHLAEKTHQTAPVRQTNVDHPRNLFNNKHFNETVVFTTESASTMPAYFDTTNYRTSNINSGWNKLTHIAFPTTEQTHKIIRNHHKFQDRDFLHSQAGDSHHPKINIASYGIFPDNLTAIGTNEHNPLHKDDHKQTHVPAISSDSSMLPQGDDASVFYHLDSQYNIPNQEDPPIHQSKSAIDHFFDRYRQFLRTSIIRPTVRGELLR